MKSRVLYGAILAVLSLAAPVRALADPVTLVCTGPTTWTFVLDATAGTAAGFPATFGNEEITWHDTMNGYDYKLNRVSGILTIYAHPQPIQYTCHPGQKQF